MTLTRSSTRVAVGMTVAVLLVLGLVGGIAPAFASHSPGTASVNRHEVQAGLQDQAFSISVTHPAGPAAPFPPNPLDPPTGTPAVNWVKVTSPPGFVIDSASGPLEGGQPAWDATVVKVGGVNRIVFFTLKTGMAGIAAGGNGAFAIQADVPRPAGELIVSNWVASVSSNGGASEATPTGDLSTRVRILKIEDVTILSPSGAADGTVSGLQGKVRDVDGDSINDEPAVMSRCRVTNFASVAHTATPTLDGGSSVIIEEAAAPASIAAGATRNFDFRLSFADVSSSQSPALQCNATSVRTDGGAGTGTTPSGFNAQMPITIQPRAVFTYNSVPSLPTFSPSALSPNKVVTFRVAVQKSGVPAVSLAPAMTRLGFLNKAETAFAIPKTNLSAGSAVPANNQANFFLEFGPVNIGALTDGRYRGVLDIRGTDANGSAVGFVPVSSFQEKLLIDAGIPVLNLNVTPPNLPTGWPTTSDHDKVARAARNGQTVTLGGGVTDVDPDTGTEGGCGTCIIVPGTAALRQFTTENGGESAGADLPVNLTINAVTGAISGSYSGSYAAGTRSVMLVARVVDVAGNQSALTLSSGCGYCPASFTPEDSAALSGRAVIDPIVPQIATARTGRAAGGSQDRLEVTLSECVYGITKAADWTFSSSPLQRVVATDPASGIPACTVNTKVPLDSVGKITLIVSQPFADDAGPGLGTVAYNPDGGLSTETGMRTRFVDRTGSQVANVTKDILDGIAPLAPEIQSIQLGTRTIGLQDGAFWTNIDNPKFLLVNPAGQDNRAIQSGYRAEIWQERNGVDGLQRGSGAGFDVELGQQNVQASNCPADDGNPATPVPPCTVLVEGNFATAGADSSDTSQTEAVHGIYAVALDTATPKNVSVETDALVEIDRIKPLVDLLSTTFGASDVEVAFTDSLAFGQDRSGDWTIVDDQDRGVHFSTVQTTGQANKRRLVPGAGEYDPDAVMLLSWMYFGPAGGRYEDRATNQMLDFETCLITVSGSEICPA